MMSTMQYCCCCMYGTVKERKNNPLSSKGTFLKIFILLHIHAINYFCDLFSWFCSLFQNLWPNNILVHLATRSDNLCREVIHWKVVYVEKFLTMTLARHFVHCFWKVFHSKKYMNKTSRFQRNSSIFLNFLLSTLMLHQLNWLTKVWVDRRLQ